MHETTQPPLPGFPLRLHVSAIWSSPTEPCSVSTVLDTPTDAYADQLIGSTTTGRMTLDEFLQVFEDCSASLVSVMERLVNGDPL